MDMSLALLIILPALGGILCVLLRLAEQPARIFSVAVLLATLAVLVVAWSQASPVTPDSPWLLELRQPWLPSFGISFHLAADGLSAIMVALTLVLAAAGVLLSANESDNRPGLFYANILWTTAGVTGVFLAMDLFLFFFFWEVMLVPLYLLVGIWGKSDRRMVAAIKMFLYTQTSGLCMLLALLLLVFSYHQNTGVYSFNYLDLVGNHLTPLAGTLVMMGFAFAFAVKLPVVPLHGWLMDAYEDAPTGAIFSGLMLKTGAYGLLRFAIPLAPDAAHLLTPWAMGLGAITVVYGMLLAFSQPDLKRKVAYISISHMGLVLLGVFAWNDLALQGVVVMMVAHGLGIAGLFAVASLLQHRLGTRDITAMGGLWKAAPRFGAGAMVFVIAALGLPGLGTFVGEFLVLLGAWQVNPWLTIVAATGMVGAAIYSLRLMHYAFHGKAEVSGMRDLNVVETGCMLLVSIPVIVLGVYPQPLLNAAAPALANLMRWSGLGN